MFERRARHIHGCVLSLALGLLAGCGGGGSSSTTATTTTTTTTPTTPTGLQIYGYPPVAQGPNVQDKLGVTTTGFLYQYDPSISSLAEGEYRLGTNTLPGYTDANLGPGLGTHVIKLWFSYQAALTQGYPNSDAIGATYPNTTMGTVNSLTDLASSPPMAKIFGDPNFNTYILEAFEFCQKTTSTGAWEGTLWRSTTGTTFNFGTDIQNCTYTDFYNLTAYLLKTYSGTGKTFVLQNWESDNALNPAAFTIPPAASETCNNPSEANYPAAWCQTIVNMRTWLLDRWNGVNDARRDNASTTSNVTVAAAAEVNLLDGVNTGSYGYPTALSQVIPYLHMDLYSCSCYHADLPPYLSTVSTEVSTLQGAIVQPTLGSGSGPTLYGTKNIYFGEFGTPENNYYSNDQWSETSSHDARYNVGQQIQEALSANLRWLLYWQVYDNHFDSPANSKGNTIDAYWLIRPPCNSTDSTQIWCKSPPAGQPAYTQTWNYFQNIMTQPYATYQNVFEAENFYTTTTGTGSEVDVADPNLTGNYGTHLQGAALNSTIVYSVFIPTAGQYAMTIRVRTGTGQGTFDVLVNGAILGSTYDTYAASTGYTTFSIGSPSLKAGSNTIAIQVVGKDAGSSAYDLVIDNISLAP